MLEPIKISVFAKSECKFTFFVCVRLETDIVHHNGGSAVQGVWLGTANTQFIERAEREVGAIIPSKHHHQPVHSYSPLSTRWILYCVPIINLAVMLIQASVTIDSELTKAACLFSAVLSQCGMCHIKSPYLPYVIPPQLFSQFKNIFGHKDLMTT